jgi:hypothetical protein
MRRFDIAERRARLARRHRLAPGSRADRPAEVADSLVALHGTDPATVHLSVLNRMRGGSLAATEDALYGERSLVRLLGMRRTVFVTTPDTAAVVQAACSRTVAARERRNLVRFVLDSGIDGAGPDAAAAEAWLARAEDVTLRALTARGEATAADLIADEPLLAARIVLSRGKSYEGRQSVASRLLAQLAAQGRVVRARPRGGWTSHQYRWAPMASWYPGGLPDLPAADAEARLARRWLRGYGPASPDDLQWWTGWTKTQTARALRAAAAVEVDLGDRPGVALPDDLEPEPPAGPWVALLSGLDPTPMGWRHRDWYLGPHAAQVFDTVGNAGPTVWCDGRVVGGWAQDAGGEVVHRLLEDVGAEATAALSAAAARLTTLLDGTRLHPRSRRPTPLEQSLAP